VRGLVRGVPVYIVPREDGTVVIGATQREDAPSEAGAVSAGGVYQLLRDAQQLVPAVAELELLEATARARPGTPDNAPLLGRVASAGSGQDVEGLIIATGFFRHGVLLTPAAAAICRALLDGEPDRRWEGFRPDRFSSRRPVSPAPGSSERDASPADAPAKDRTTA
jgi:glycine oxidase